MAGLAVLVGAGPAWSTARPARPVRVLFVCQFGTVKSAVAREIFRRRARERGIAAIAMSRGITPADHTTLALRQHLAADGIDSTVDKLRKLRAEDLRTADIAVAFNPLPDGMARADVIDWSVSPSMNDAYPEAKADIERRIDALLDEIARRK